MPVIAPLGFLCTDSETFLLWVKSAREVKRHHQRASRENLKAEFCSDCWKPYRREMEAEGRCTRQRKLP